MVKVYCFPVGVTGKFFLEGEASKNSVLEFSDSKNSVEKCPTFQATFGDSAIPWTIGGRLESQKGLFEAIPLRTALIFG